MERDPTMLLLVTSLSLLFHTWTCSANPGLSVQISQKGFDYASQISSNKLQQFMQNARIPDMSKSGSLEYTISNININSFSGLNSNVQLVPSNQLKWTLSIGNVQMSLNWKYSKKVWCLLAIFLESGSNWYIIFPILISQAFSTVLPVVIMGFRIRDSGSARLTFTGTRLSVNVALSKTGNNGLNIRASGCSSNTNLRISTSSFILRILLYFFKGRISSAIESQMCQKAVETINNNLAPRLSNFPVTIPFANDYIFDYGLVSNPVISSTSMKSNHKAAVYYNQGSRTIPFTPNSLPSITGNNRMITIILSDYVFDTWLYAAYQQGILKYMLSPATLPENMGSILQTTCPGLCIGSIIPEIGSLFPNSTLTLSVKTADRPQTVFLPNRIQVNIPAEIQALIVTPGTKAEVFTMKLGVATEMSVKLEKSQIYFAITNLKFNLGAIKSKFIQNYDSAALQNTINPLLKQLVTYFNNFGPNGMPLVLPDKTHISNPSLRIVKDAIVVAADVKIDSF